ncbi:hypothetical protein GCM10011504_54680 [Siccirubricoccus deserti]|nr:hypothetical protein GCM10011504_54680 [Siccirubricoccus deserti]
MYFRVTALAAITLLVGSPAFPQDDAGPCVRNYTTGQILVRGSGSIYYAGSFGGQAEPDCSPRFTQFDVISCARVCINLPLHSEPEEILRLTTEGPGSRTPGWVAKEHGFEPPYTRWWGMELERTITTHRYCSTIGNWAAAQHRPQIGAQMTARVRMTYDRC